MHNPFSTTETYFFFTNLDVVSEIELLWCFKDEKRSRKNNPTCLYYLASKESILEHKIKLEEETNELFKKLCGVSETPKVTPILEQTR